MFQRWTRPGLAVGIFTGWSEDNLDDWMYFIEMGGGKLATI